MCSPSKLHLWPQNIFVIAGTTDVDSEFLQMFQCQWISPTEPWEEFCTKNTQEWIRYRLFSGWLTKIYTENTNGWREKHHPGFSGRNRSESRISCAGETSQIWMLDILQLQPLTYWQHPLLLSCVCENSQRLCLVSPMVYGKQSYIFSDLGW